MRTRNWQPVEMTVSRKAADEVPPYARLLQSAMCGDSSLFARADLVEAQWEIVEPVLGNVTPLFFYEPGAGALARPTAFFPTATSGTTLEADHPGSRHEQHRPITARRGRRLGVRRHGGGARAAASTRPGDDRRPLEPSPLPAASLPGGDRCAQPGRHRGADPPGLPPSVERERDARRRHRRRRRGKEGHPGRRSAELRYPHPGDGCNARVFRP